MSKPSNQGGWTCSKCGTRVTFSVDRICATCRPPYKPTKPVPPAPVVER